MSDKKHLSNNSKIQLRRIFNLWGQKRLKFAVNLLKKYSEKERFYFVEKSTVFLR